MRARSGARWGLGLVLILLGLKNIVYPHPYPPVGLIEDFSSYGFNGALVTLGGWLVLGRRKISVAAGSDEN